MNDLFTAESQTSLQVRSKIDDLEQVMRDAVKSGDLELSIADGTTEEGSDQCEHHFAEGVYARTLLIPADSCVVGRIHHQSRICIISQGTCLFVDEHQRREVSAPWIGEFKAGCKTAVYAITDTTWTAVLGTEMTEPIEILKALSSSTHSEYAEISAERLS